MTKRLQSSVPWPLSKPLGLRLNPTARPRSSSSTFHNHAIPLRTPHTLKLTLHHHARFSTAPPPPSVKPHIAISKNSVSHYIQQLRSRYPHADPASLIASFLLLHELTALIPLILAFFALSTLGAGESSVTWLLEDRPGREGQESWLKKAGRRWVALGEEKAERIGRYYGVFGFDKETKEERAVRRTKEKAEGEEEVVGGERVYKPHPVSGDVANMVGAYVVVKLLMPFRLLLSARYAPAVAEVVGTRFHRLRNIGLKYLKRNEK